MSDVLRHNLNVREGEEILRVIRRHWTAFFWSYFFVFVFVVGPFFLIIPLFQWGMNGIIVFFALLSCGIILALRAFVSWFFNACVITTERVIDIDQRGFFDRIVVEAPFVKIQDVTFHRKGLSQFLLRHAIVTIQLRGVSESLYFRHMRNPERLQELIIKSVEHMQQQIKPSPGRRGEGEVADHAGVNDAEVIHRTDV